MLDTSVLVPRRQFADAVPVAAGDRVLPISRARPVAREGEPGDARLRGGNRRATAPPHWDALSTGVSPGRSDRTPREANRRAETGNAWLAVSTQHSAIMFAMHRQHSGRVSPGRALSPEEGRPCADSEDSDPQE